jgi:hypothetical protein
MKHIKIYEQFKEGPMEKPKGFFSKMIQGAKHSLGFENQQDRKDIDSLHRAIDSSREYDFVNNVREIKPGVIVAYVANSSVTVDINTPEIMYKGRVLDLNNTDEEAEYLYNRLRRLTESFLYESNIPGKSHEDLIKEVIDFIKYHLETTNMEAGQAFALLLNAKSKMPWLLLTANGEPSQEWKELLDWVFNKYPQLANNGMKPLQPWQKDLNTILNKPRGKFKGFNYN